MAGFGMDCVFVVEDVISGIENLGKRLVVLGLRGSEVLVATEELWECLALSPVADCEALVNYGIIVWIYGCDSWPYRSTGDRIVGESCSKFESDDVSEEVTVVREGIPSVGIGRKLAEGGVDSWVGQTASKEAAGQFGTETRFIVAMGMVEMDGPLGEADAETSTALDGGVDLGFEMATGYADRVRQNVAGCVVRDHVVGCVSTAMIACDVVIAILLEGRYGKEFWWVALVSAKKLFDVGEYRRNAFRVLRGYVK
jgi:hypothetical protein